jgi:hypothetical protein
MTTLGRMSMAAYRTAVLVKEVPNAPAKVYTTEKQGNMRLRLNGDGSWRLAIGL